MTNIEKQIAGQMEIAALITSLAWLRKIGMSKGLSFTVQKALPLVHDGGSIILNASIGASKGVEATSVYSATKAAIRSFARTWTVDLKERKIVGSG